MGSTGRGVFAIVLVLLHPIFSQTQQASLAEYDLSAAAGAQRRMLPLELREISGFATTPDGRLFAHADEQALIAELDANTGQIRKLFSLGAPAAPGDFEGIAFAHGRFFLITSTGVIYSGEEGKNRTGVPFQRHDTGAGKFCEIEGLAYDAASDRFLLPCKEPRRKELRGRLIVLGVPAQSMRVEATPVVSVPHAQLAPTLRGVTPHATSVEVHPRSGAWLILSSNPSALIEVSAGGSLLAVAALQPRLHAQPEALAFTGNLTLLVADEGGQGPGMLVSYPQRKK